MNDNTNNHGDQGSLDQEGFWQVQSDDQSDLPKDDLWEPPRRPSGRSPYMMVAVMGFSVVLMVLFYEDLQFFRQRGEPTDLGTTSGGYRQDPQGPPPLDLAHNSYVKIGGLAAFPAVTSGDIIYFKLAFAPVLVRLEDTPHRLAMDWVHYEVAGRLVNMDVSTRYAGIKRYYRDKYDLDTRGYYLLLADVRPSKYWYVPILYGLFSLFILVNLGLLVRRVVTTR